MSHFSAFIRKQCPLPRSSRPLFHACHLATFERIVEAQSLMPAAEPCKVLEAKVSFAFYGRTAYRVDTPATAAAGLAPCVIIFNSDAATRLHSVHPFDTGGLRYYQFGKAFSRADFLLESLHDAERVVSVYWKTYRDYLHFNAAHGIRSLPGLSTVPARYSELLKGIGVDSTADDRRGSIEVALSDPIPLNRSTVFGLVLPVSAVDNDGVRSCLEANQWFGSVAFYEYNGGQPVEYHRKILDLVEAMFSSS